MDMNKWKTNKSAITQFGGPEVLTIQSSPNESPESVGESRASINPLVRKRAGLGWVTSKKESPLGSVYDVQEKY